MLTNKLKGFVLLPTILIIVGLLAAGTAAAAVFSPQTFNSISKGIKENQEVLTVKINNLESKYLAEGASEDTILVKFKDGVNEEQINKLHSNFQTKTKKKISKINVEVVSLSSNGKVGDAIDKFKTLPEVEYVEQNFLASAQLEPNDSFYPNQWNLKKISAPLAWDDTQGGAGPIAVVDTGVLSTHPDLSGEVLEGYNFVSDSAITTDDNGHGTHVSGIISALTNNGVGVASIGFRSNILPVKVLNSSGSGTYADVASGIIYSADHGAKVINLSLGGPTASITLQNAVNYAVNKGSFVVASAGNNSSSTPLYPAACSGALAVTATDSSDNIASFSSYGTNVFAGAPGVNINSTFNDSGYKSLSGTSMAAPHFAGLLEIAFAYMGTANKSVTNQQLLDYLKKTMDKVGPYPYDQNGWNQYYGYGRINASNLITEIKDSPSESPTATITPVRTKTAFSSPTEIPSDKGSSAPRSKYNFNVELSATVDYVNTDDSVIKVKIKSISQNMKLSADDIVDLYLADDTEVKNNGKAVSISDIKSDDKISVKGLWSDNRLVARLINIQKENSNEPVITPTQNQSQENSSNNNNGSNNSNSNSNNNNNSKSKK